MRAEPPGDAVALVDRRIERAGLDQIVADVVAGQSRVTVLRGEAGVGKSALLGYLLEQLDGWHVARAAGVESEMELAYSGLHQLCGPFLDRHDRLPEPQRDALATVFGLSAGPPPDRFLVGVATLSLFADAAEETPLACIIDDAQWLDRASAQILGFVARRLGAERVAVVCATRAGVEDEVLAGLPETVIEGLAENDARALLMSSLRAPLDAAVCSQIIAESKGNPLALLELPRTWNSVELAFGFSSDQQVAGKIEQSFEHRVAELPRETRLLLLAAAAEPRGDPLLLRHAIDRLGIDMSASAAAVTAGLIRIGLQVEFAHPLVRSAVYRAAAAEDRAGVHRALAAVSDPVTDPDRRAWHRACATVEPDEEVAAELEGSAGRAQARGGVAAASAFLRRAVALSVDPAPRIERGLAAAQASMQAGTFEAALASLAAIEADPLDGHQAAMVDLLRANVVFASGAGRDAPPQLLRAAQGIEPFSVVLARETYLVAWVSVIVAGDPTGDVLDAVCRGIQALPDSVGTPTPLDLLTDGLARLVTDGHAAAAPTLKQAASALADLPVDDALRWGWAGTAASDSLWDEEGSRAIAAAQIRVVRNVGALAQLPVPLAAMGTSATLRGDFPGASLVIAEADAIGAATGTRYAPFTAVRLLCLQGRVQEARSGIADALEQAEVEGQVAAAKSALWAEAILENGLGRHEAALVAATRATGPPFEPFVSTWALPELIEAAHRCGEAEVAQGALDRLAVTTQAAGTDYGLGIEARCRALLSAGVADALFVEAIERLARAHMRPDVARAHLLYGERLRREDRRADGREQLRTAHDLFTAIGMGAFEERARRELVALGGRVASIPSHARRERTPQEEQIARLARDGHTNKQIGEMLFLSPRTVEYHLAKVFPKLGITARSELRATLPRIVGESTPG